MKPYLHQKTTKKPRRTRSLLRGPGPILSLLVAELFLCSSILPAWANDVDHLRPASVSRDGGRRLGELKTSLVTRPSADMMAADGGRRAPDTQTAQDGGEITVEKAFSQLRTLLKAPDRIDGLMWADKAYPYLEAAKVLGGVTDAAKAPEAYELLRDFKPFAGFGVPSTIHGTIGMGVPVQMVAEERRRVVEAAMERLDERFPDLHLPEQRFVNHFVELARQLMARQSEGSRVAFGQETVEFYRGEKTVVGGKIRLLGPTDGSLERDLYNLFELTPFGIQSRIERTPEGQKEYIFSTSLPMTKLLADRTHTAKDGGRKPFKEVERAGTLLERIQTPAVGRADPMRMP